MMQDNDMLRPDSGLLVLVKLMTRKPSPKSSVLRILQTGRSESDAPAPSRMGNDIFAVIRDCRDRRYWMLVPVYRMFPGWNELTCAISS